MIPADWASYLTRSETRHDSLTRRMVEGLRATLDHAPAFAGHEAPQGAHFLLAPVIVPMSELGADGHPKKGGFMPPIALPRRMWAGSRILFHRALQLGEEVSATARIASITPKTGKSGELVFVEVERAYRAGDTPLVTETQTIVYRGADSGGGSAAPAAPPPPEVWQEERSVIPDEVMLFRYSALTFNGHRIHYDLAYAREQEGYAGLIVHGPLTATLLLDFAARLFGENALKTFSFKALSPAYGGAKLTLRARREGGKAVLAAFGPDGPVMRGEAEL